MKDKLKKSLIFGLIFAVLGYAIGVALVVFTQYDGGFETGALTDQISLLFLAGGFLLGLLASTFLSHS